jgi:hypothetical protein
MPKPTQKPTSDGSNKPGESEMKITIQPRFAVQIRLWLDAKDEQAATTFVNQAVREKLEREGFWPPAAQD